MNRFARRRPSPATVISLVALFVALGGTSLAAVNMLVPKNSVNSASVIDGSLQKVDLSGKAVVALKGNRGAPGAQGAAGPAGAVGPAGQPGVAGAAGTPGAQGATGPAGANGTDGANGTNGAPGATGASGPQGATGQTGPTDLSKFGRVFLGQGGDVNVQPGPPTTVASATIAIGGASNQWVFVQGTLSWKQNNDGGACTCTATMSLRELAASANSPNVITSVATVSSWSASTVQWVFLGTPGTHNYDFRFNWSNSVGSGDGTALVQHPVISAVSIPLGAFGTPP
jgi:hypothetical protein